MLPSDVQHLLRRFLFPDYNTAQQSMLLNQAEMMGIARREKCGILGGKSRVLPAVCWRKERELLIGTLSNTVYI